MKTIYQSCWRDIAFAQSLDLARVRESLASPVVIDGRNLFSREQMLGARLNYYSVGREAIKLMSIANSSLTK